MDIHIREITDKKMWEDFHFPHKTFLHSWNWGEFQKNTGEKIFRLGLFRGEHLEGVALIIKVVARRGSFLFCPHGPLMDYKNPELFSTLLHYLRELGEKENVSCIRFSPLILDTPEHRKIFRCADFRGAPIHMMHPEITWTLDLEPSEDELLRSMRKTTRYLIRKAEKDGVRIRMLTDSTSISAFYEIHQDTVSRQHFVPFSLQYLQEEFRAFHEDNHIAVFLAEYEGKNIAGAVIVFYGDCAYYHHGASFSNSYQKIPASYLVQFEVIREAKRRGLRHYNFWGIAPDDEPHHPWAGLSLFKKGFGGYATQYLHAQDFVLKPSYWFTYAVEKIRRKWRGL